MSYAPTAYAIDLDALKALYGSKDTKLATKIVAKLGEEIAEKNAWFEDDIVKGAPRVEDALRELIAGTCTKKKHGFMYAYALELACGVLGTNLYAAEWLNSEWFDAFQDVLPKGRVKKLLTATNVTENPKMIVPIPKPGDFPGMGYFTVDECVEIAAALEPVKLDPDEDYGDFTGEDLEEGLTELRGWLKKATAKRRGLMLFTY